MLQRSCVLSSKYFSIYSINYFKMGKPRKPKVTKKSNQNDTDPKEHEATISVLQKFRNNTGSKIESQIKTENKNIEQDIADQPKIESQEKTENINIEPNIADQPKTEILYVKNEIDEKTVSPVQDNKKALKRPHVKVELESPKKEGDVTESKKSNFIATWEPQNWKEALQNLEKMREKKGAPVDTMGCHMAADLNAEPIIKRFHFLIALMLSSQTKDQVNYDVMQKLIKLPGGLTVDVIRNIDEKDLAELLRPVSFYKTKAKHIKLAVEILKDKYNCDIPKTSVDLCKLPGVGPKMAHICMQVAWNETTGIGVDTHVHRISNRMGWVKKPTKTPEETRVALESWLPKEYWADVNTWMVGLGQTICKPIKPNCSGCLNKELCPVGQGKKKP
ncbi:endonuclease III-like protein 1 [Ctenocephalides felis]|uniref:endonuclease III-like protein 1 n=1 Tax=Ctenocephalides felis TaxID=7515 RepID=UPI000E6E4808|nr:endonuclease III-like protein 1 [Ctenocephalides felis]XP_026477833.1 endonuclease III-like protein 1 [Ctenocephalides felis]